MGNVYRAVELGSSLPVAVKVVNVANSIDVGRFDREAESLARLTHPAIVRYIAHGVTDDGLHYLVQEWIDGVRLSTRLSSEGMSLNESITLITRVATALGEAHELGIVHRDLKPSNLLLEGNDCSRVRVLDFGIARLLDATERLTRTGTAVGTPGYMAPEQAAGAAGIDPRTDVFGLGCVLYFCLAGMPPFPGHNATAVRTKVLLCDPPALAPRCPEAPPALIALVERMLEKSRARRPDDANAVVAELERIALPKNGDVRRGQVLLAETRQIAGVGPSTDITDLEDDEFVSMVFLRDTSDDDVVLDTERLESLRAAVTVFGGELEVVSRDSVILKLQGEPLETAIRAARSALVLASAIPTAGVAISSGAWAALTEVIEDGTQNLEGAVLERLFVGEQAPCIHIDALTAELLRSQFTIEEESNRRYILRPRRSSEGE